MNRIFTTALVAMFILAASIPSFAQSAIDINGIKISASGSFGFVGTHENVGNLDGETYANGDPKPYSNYDKNEVEYVMSLALEKTFSTDGTVFIKIKGGGVTGASPLSLGWFRSGVDDDAYDPDIDQIVINEVHYTQPLGDLWSIKVGRFGDAGSPNDVASSVGSFFLGDPTIPGARGGSWQNPYGVQLDYSPIPLLSVEYQYLTQAYTHNYDGDVPNYHTVNYTDITRTPYNVLFVNFKPIENGNYRIGYWQDTAKREFANYRQTTVKEVPGYYRQGGGAEPQGVFLSFDQQIIENLSAFFRGGYRLDETFGSGPGQAKTSWQIGAKVGGAFWGRANDSFFIAVGQAQAPENIEFFDYSYLPSKDGAIGENLYGKGYEKPKAETHFELNYLFNINEQVSIVAFGQYVGDIYSWVTEWQEDKDDEGNTYTYPGYPIRPKQDYGYAGGLKLVLAF